MTTKLFLEFRQSHRLVRFTRCIWIAALALTLVSTKTSYAQADTPNNEPASKPVITKPVFPVTTFKILFDRKVDPDQLDREDLLNQPVTLAQVDGVYTAPQPGLPGKPVTLASLTSEQAKQYDYSALQAITQDLVAYLYDEVKLEGIIVGPMPTDITPDLTDRRKGRADLTFLIKLASVGKVRTLASGDRIDPDDREDHPLHESIRSRSPLQAGDQPREGTIVARRELDDFLYRLNRHPGRRVDSAISESLIGGEVSLDYLVAENKPWYVYFQLANNGTDSTNEWRERFGFVHNQLTAHDDTLSIDYVTAGFDESHAVTLGYTRPLSERWELRLNALYSQFDADQVGSPLTFTGEDTAFGAQLAYNYYQNGAFFLDAVGGLEYYYTTAQNPLAGLDGAEGLFLATLGTELERVTDLSQTRGFARLRGNLNQADAGEFNALGRTAPDTQFLVMQYALTTSFYLEPLLNRRAWEDISDPSTSTLAHEIALSARGQWAIGDDRLVPTFQAVAGGLNTVRGYEQAEVAGDSSLILSAEYRFHLPRIFEIESPRKVGAFDRPFRVAPESVYGRPDWDLILKGFIDYAMIDTTDELAFESDDTLLSTGVGLELALKNNINFRADWGIALQDAGTAEAGDNRFHFVLTLLY